MTAIEKQKLREIVAKGNRARNALSDLEEKEKEIVNRKLIGKCFVFQNSYGPDSRWPMYIKVIGVSGSYLNTICFQTTSHGEMQIRNDDGFGLVNNCQEIPINEYKRAWDNIMDKIRELKP